MITEEAILSVQITVDEPRHLCPLQNLRRDAPGDPLSRLVDRVARQVRVARHRLDIAVPEQLANHRQGC